MSRWESVSFDYSNLCGGSRDSRDISNVSRVELERIESKEFFELGWVAGSAVCYNEEESHQSNI